MPAKRRFRIRIAVCALLGLAAILVVARTVPFGRYDPSPEPPRARAGGGYSYGVPLDPESPWPKFRANELQNGRSPVLPKVDPAARPWTFPTGKGIFSSPVVDAEGTAYVGSADHVFYAIRRDGSLRWKFETGEIIDSSALLDDRGRLYFGSGDRRLYCLERATGKLVWKFEAHTPEQVRANFGVETHNLAWFEGNVSMLPDGTLLAPNDNCLVYAVDRDGGTMVRHYAGNEMVWSAPAVNAATGRIFFGTTNLALKTAFAYEAESGKLAWTAGGLGSVAATGLLTSLRREGALVVGSFDGFVRAYAQGSGKRLWSFGARDHIYASPAQLSDGTIIQASADGTVYALDPRNGARKWAFDALEPIRSSPAVGGDDRIYVGSGEGRLFCLEPDGRLRWSYRCIEGDRNDLNASPALGAEGIYIAGESGGIFFVPYDYPLGAAGADDPRCSRGAQASSGEELPADGAFLLYTTRFGAVRVDPPREIAANESLTLSLFARSGGDTLLAAIDAKSLSVVASGGPLFRASVSADRRFLTLVPDECWAGPEGGELVVAVKAGYRTGLSRVGLKFFGGRRSGVAEARLSLRVAPRAGAGFPYAVPAAPGDRQTVFELSRLAAPNPTMLPSWNQIGFDSLHYLAGLVETRGAGGAAAAPGTGSAVAWVIGGRLEGGATVVDPALEVRYPLVLDYDRGLVTLRNYEGFKINFVGSWDMPFGRYRIAAAADPATGVPRGPAALDAVALCDQIKFYGLGLKLMGMTEFDSGRMTVSGGVNLGLWPDSRNAPIVGVEAAFGAGPGSAWADLRSASLAAGERVYSLLLVDEASGLPVPLYYTKRTKVEADAAGLVRRVSVSFDKGEAEGAVRAYLMVDCYPAARGRVTIPPR